MIIILMGVAGAGKTTVGQTLALELGWQFADADDFHPAANVAKMRAGIPLNNADRAPWLETLRQASVQWLADRKNVVLACSALKAAYRERLLVSPEVNLVYLHVTPEIAAERAAKRRGSFLNPQLVPSQFETLEEPQDAVRIDATLPVKEIVQEIRAALRV